MWEKLEKNLERKKINERVLETIERILERRERFLERRERVLRTCAATLERECINFVYIGRKKCNYVKIYDTVDFFWSLLKLKFWSRFYCNIVDLFGSLL